MMDIAVKNFNTGKYKTGVAIFIIICKGLMRTSEIITLFTCPIVFPFRLRSSLLRKPASF